MHIIKLIVTLFLFATISVVNGQPEMAMNDNGDEIEKGVKANAVNHEAIPAFDFNYYEIGYNIDGSNLRHTFGGDVALKKEIFLNTYSVSTPIAPGNPGMRMVIQKPVIYNAVKELERYYKKQVRKSDMTRQDAKVYFSKVLDVAIAAFPNNTKLFEDELESRKDIEIIALIFQQATVNN